METLSSSSEYWIAQKWGKLCLDSQQNLPDHIHKNSHKKMNFLCDCGRTIFSNFASVTRGVKSCGRCFFQPAAFWLAQKWGKLKIDPNQSLPPEWGLGTEIKFRFLCDCGNHTSAVFGWVYSGNSRSCGECSHKKVEYWLAQKWGKLLIDPSQPLPKTWGPGCKNQIRFICDCGKKSIKIFKSVFSGNTKSCGLCSSKPQTYWFQQIWGSLKLDPNQKIPKNLFPGSHKKLRFICDCGKNKLMIFKDVFDGKSVSCGCLRPGHNKFSPAIQIYDYIKTLHPDAVLSHWFKASNGARLEYDIYVPSHRLAIEYHGLIWHSEKYSKNKKRDWEKFKWTEQRGDRLIQIYQDEWRDKRLVMEAFLQYTASIPAIRIKPAYKIYDHTPKEARAFLDARHYLGAAGGCLTVVAKHKSEIVGVWVFMKREAGTVLWHRACWDHKYKTWNPHQRALDMAVPLLKQMGFTRILTFSDNRFHTGNLYEKLGFTFEKELKPDYGYTDGVRRVSKYALRVPAGINEQQEAATKGWYRIWDSGKKRYTLLLYGK
jgi:hypothetical protein